MVQIKMFFPAKQNLFSRKDHDKMRKWGIFKNKVEEDIEMKIYHAQVNHLENPMGFRMERTVFPGSERRGRKKTELCENPCSIGCSDGASAV